MFSQHFAKKVKVPLPKVSILKRDRHFSVAQLLAFVVVFMGIGGYIIYGSFASTPTVASLQAEQMTLPTGASVYSDSTASGGQAVQFSTNGTATGSVTIPSGSTATSLSVTAHSNSCHGWASVSLNVDGTNVLPTTTASSSGWTNYSATVNLVSGSHSLSLSAGNTGSKGHCTKNLYVDVTTFSGPAPIAAPTIAFSASPTSVASGSGSTLTWSTTNATSCTAAGAWSGSEPTSGSQSTGALNANATYSLACTGTGGSVNASAVVSVSGASANPTWYSDFASKWGEGTTNSFNHTYGWWGFDGVPSGFIGLQGWSFQNNYFSFVGNPDPTVPGSAFKATVDQNAATTSEAGQRTGIYLTPADPNSTPVSQNQSGAYEGSDVWYRAHVYFPADYQPEPNTSWNWFNEFHNYPNSICCANISMGIVTDTEDGGTSSPSGRFSIRVLGGGNPTTPIPDGTNMGNASVAPNYGGAVTWSKGPNLVLGHRYDVLMHVKWAWEPNIGQVQLYLDGTQIVNYTGPTLYYMQHDGTTGSPAGPSNDYWYAGNYRSGVRNGATDTQVDSIYHDGYMWGPTRSSVGG